ncbi:MAG: choice-of-anchor L domain-containing protein [Xenococcaceae cyanobacterium MO_167.B52]|nr:choice-of-anchor L domain-containing protein [Xenococcaceae cyanobacterium MO_167.B52]
MNKLYFLQKLSAIIFAGTAGLIGLQAGAQAITITRTTDVNDLITALIADNSGITVTGATLSGQSLITGEASTGTFTNVSGTYNGIGSKAGGIVISTGDVGDYADGPDTSPLNSTIYGVTATPAQEALLDPLSAGNFNHFDVTQFDITFDMMPGKDTVFFDVAFGSDEFFDSVGTQFVDAFGLIINGNNIAFANGSPININNPGGLRIPGTELNGVVTENTDPVLTFSQFVGDGSTGNTLTFIIGDATDPLGDSTAYISNLGSEPPNAIPEPNAIFGLFSIMSLASTFKRKK